MARTTIPAELVAVNAIQGTLIADNAITAVHIATNAVSGTLVADNSITSTHIAQNQVTATQIAQNTITVTQLADSAVETAKLNNDAVTQAKIADDAVGADQLAANSVVSASIVNGTIVEADMADNAVTLAKMASLARGSIIVGDSAGDPSALSIGSNTYVLTSDGTDISWAASSGGLSTSGGTLTGDLTMGGMILNPNADGGRIGFNRNPASGAHVGDSSLKRFQVNGPDSTSGDHLQIQSYNSSGTHQGNLTFQDGNLTFGDDQHLYLGDSTSDFDIYHIAGSINVIRGNTGLVLQSDDTSYGIQMGTYSGGETMFKAVKNGGVELYYDNTKHFETVDNGVTVPATYRYFVDGGGDTYMSEYSANEFEIVTGNTRKFALSGGNLYHTGSINSNHSFSDERLKENIVVITNALEKVSSLRGITFTRKDDGSVGTGLIAQELEKVLPEAVYESKTIDSLENDDAEEWKAINYGNTVGLLVEAIKELEARIKELE